MRLVTLGARLETRGLAALVAGTGRARVLGMTNTELQALAETVAATLETTITRAFDGATFTYKPVVALRPDPRTYREGGTRVNVSVPVNAVLDRTAALAMMNAFRKALVATAGPDVRLTAKTTKARGGGRTSIHSSGYVHMGVFHVDGFWCSFSVEA